MFLYFGQPTVTETAPTLGVAFQKREPSPVLWNMGGDRLCPRGGLCARFWRLCRGVVPARAPYGAGRDSTWRH